MTVLWFNSSVSARDVSTSSGDFVRATSSVSFTAGETGPKTVTFATENDIVVEINEEFTVSLSSTSEVTLGGSATVIIIDNDGMDILEIFH